VFSQHIALTNVNLRQLLYKQKIPGGNSDGYPDSGSYIETRFLPMSSIGIFFAFFSMLACCIFSWCRICAPHINCCRKSKFAKLCCGTGAANPDGYRKQYRQVFFFILLMCSLGLALASMIGQSGVSKVFNGAEALFGKALQEAKLMEAVSEITIDSMELLNENPDKEGMKSALDSVKSSVQSSYKTVDDIDDDVKAISKVYYALYSLNCLLGYIAYCCKYGGRPALAMALTGFGLLVSSWLFFGGFYSFGAFMDDTCVEMQKWFECKAPGQDTKGVDCTQLPISKLLRCADAQTYVVGFEGTYDTNSRLIAEYRIKFPKSTVKFTYPNETCPDIGCLQRTSTTSNYDALVYRERQYYALSSSAERLCFIPGKDPESYSSKCVTTCTQSPITMPPSSESCYQKAIIASADAMWGNTYIASCNYLTELSYSAVQSGTGSCYDLSNGFVYLFCAHGLIGVMYMFVVLVGIRGSKAWSEENYQEVLDAKYMANGDSDDEIVILHDNTSIAGMEMSSSPVHTQHHSPQQTVGV